MIDKLLADSTVNLCDLQWDLVFHLEEVQGISTLQPYQREIIRAIEKHKRVAIRSCHDMGKTWLLSRVVLAIGSGYPGAKIITTAPTGRQVKLLLWSEIRTGHARSKYPLGGQLGIQEWKLASDWYAVGFTTQKQASGGEGQANSGFQGIHGDLVVVIFDEATGIPPDIWKQLEGLLTSHHVKFIAIGNPTSKSSVFYTCFSDSAYKKIHLSCFQSPNLIAAGITDFPRLEDERNRLKELSEDNRLLALQSYPVIVPQLLTTEWVMGMALKLGLDHPLFVSKVLGNFPDEDERCLMPLGLIEQAQARKRPELGLNHSVYLGVDPARFGSDTSVITVQHVNEVRRVKRLQKRSTTELSGAVIDEVNRLHDEERKDVVITVDATGIGSGVVDQLNEYRLKNETKWQGVRVIELHFGETFKEGRDGTDRQVEEKKSMFVNKKAEMYIKLAEDLKKDLILPENSDFYGEQLPTIIYQFDSKGRWVIEDKEKYKKRTGRGSPDEADSLALCNYGRHYTAGIGKFTEEFTKVQSRTFAGRLTK